LEMSDNLMEKSERIDTAPSTRTRYYSLGRISNELVAQNHAGAP
jgi:hypothetical protein